MSGANIAAVLSIAFMQTPPPDSDSGAHLAKIVRAASLLNRGATEKDVETAAGIIEELRETPNLTPKEKEMVLGLRGMESAQREILMGRERISKVGGWEVKSGKLTAYGLKRYGLTEGVGRRFAFATQRSGEWILGVSVVAGEKAPKAYLLAPTSFPPGREVTLKQSTGGDFVPVQAPVNADGTLRVTYPFPANADTITWQFLSGQPTAFNLKGMAEVHAAVTKAVAR